MLIEHALKGSLPMAYLTIFLGHQMNMSGDRRQSLADFGERLGREGLFDPQSLSSTFRLQSKPFIGHGVEMYDLQAF